MPRPAYPPDWSSTIRGLQTGLRRAYTAAQTRIRYAAIRAASIILGEENSNRITIDPDPGGIAPRITVNTASGESRLFAMDGGIGMVAGPLDPADPTQLTGTGGAVVANLGFSALSAIDDRGDVVAQARAWLSEIALLYATGGTTIGRIRANSDRAEVYHRDYGWVLIDSDGVFLGAHDGSGGYAAYMWIRSDGTIATYESGAAAASAESGETLSSTTGVDALATEPDGEESLADQVARLRADVDELAAQVAAMPRFVHVSADQVPQPPAEEPPP